MCGIVGYVGKKRDSMFLLNKLKKLEYRGYDSAGVCDLSNGKLRAYKSIGKISNLEKKVGENYFHCAILHTRWATNGAVCLKNCHPHISQNSTWAVVHNGIIENCLKLKNNLITKPESDTDTAIIAEGLEEQEVSNIFEFIDFFNQVEGGFAIVAINKNFENSLFLAKRKNPLYIASDIDNNFLVASDPICFNNFSKKYYSLEDDEFAIIKNNKINFYSKNKSEIKKPTVEINGEFENSEKEHYSTFMQKEIFEEEVVLKKQVDVYKTQKLLDKFDKNFLDKFKTIKLIGCGTAYHACLVGAKYFEKILNLPAEAEIASEFCYKNPNFVDASTLVILISQSGETADTLNALEIAKNNNAYTLAFTNVMYSSLSKSADKTLPICAGVEIAVASTKAYVCQVSALYLFVNYFKRQNTKNSYFDEIAEISDKILQFDKTNLNNIASRIYQKNKCFFIGKDLDFITAREAALKINETTYIISNAYPSGELKHGYLALIENKTPIFVFASQQNIKTKTLNSAEEAHSRGAERILITNEKNISSENLIFIDEENELLMPILAIAPIQYLACEISRLKSIDPDKPRHLAKSVTVE